jgi:signal peptidase II
MAQAKVDSMREIFSHRSASGLRWLWLAALMIVLDQITKLWVLDTLVPYQDVIQVTGFFNLVHVHNPGAAFSLFADQPGWQRGFFIGVAAVASTVIVYLLARTHPQSRRETWFCVALALILGGAIGNVIDRVLYGYVIDFLDVYAGTWHWPAFNVADSAITIGAGLLIWDSFKKD